MTDKIVILSTCSSGEEAERIARRLVETRLAACVTALPGGRSFYWWKGAIEEAGEWLLVIKSRRGLFERLRAELEKVHSYEVPEALVLSVADGAPNYLIWLEAELARDE